MSPEEQEEMLKRLLQVEDEERALILERNQINSAIEQANYMNKVVGDTKDRLPQIETRLLEIAKFKEACKN